MLYLCIMVYFIGNKLYNYVKIGHTVNNVKGRLVSLQVGCPFDLEILGIVDGNKNTEKQLHKKFDEYWIRGEWFKLCWPIYKYIKEYVRLDSVTI